MTLKKVMERSSELYSKSELMEYLKANRESDRALSEVREKYVEKFGNELIWRYTISDGLHAGLLIVVVQEGFLCLPYHNIDKDDGEIFEMEYATFLNEDALDCFIQDWVLFSDDLLGALKGMIDAIKSK